MEQIEFEGKSYPVRSLVLPHTGEEVRISTTELSGALMTEEGGYTSKEARRIDEGIFYFVSPDEIGLDDGSLALLVEREALDLYGQQVDIDPEIEDVRKIITEERPYSIQYGSWPGPGDPFGDVHVRFDRPQDAVSFKEMQSLAAGFGGEARIMDGKEWGDFSREEDAVRFATRVTTLNEQRLSDAAQQAAARQTPDQMEDKSMSLEKDVIREHFEGWNKDFYNVTMDPTIAERVKRADIGTGMKLAILANDIALDLMRAVQQQKPVLLERYGVDSIEKEASCIANEAVEKVVDARYNRDNQIEEKITKALESLNKVTAMHNEALMAKDHEYLLHEHVKSYSLANLGNGNYAIKGGDGLREEFVTPNIKAREALGKITDMEASLLKEMGADISASREAVLKSHPDYDTRQQETYMLGFVAGRNAGETRQAAETARQANPRITDVQVILPVSKEYYITAKVDDRQMFRATITRQEAKSMAEGDLDLVKVAERKYARQMEQAEKRDNGLKR